MKNAGYGFQVLYSQPEAWGLGYVLMNIFTNFYRYLEGCCCIVLRFNTTLTAKVISWRSVMHMCFLVFLLSPQCFQKASFSRSFKVLDCVVKS